MAKTEFSGIVGTYNPLFFIISFIFMKKFFISFLVLSFGIFSPSVFAEKADHFEITVKSPVRVGQATDMTVTVLDKAGAVKKDYAGTIYVIVDNDSKATVPYADEGYSFRSADQGTITFSKGLSFTKEGKMTVTVIDAEDDNLEGVVSVTVENASDNTPVATKEPVTITSPDNNSEIPSDSINITGVTKKNSNIQIWLNGKLSGETQTSTEGDFVYALKNLDQEQNVLQVKLLDGNDEIIGESESISFTISIGGPTFNDITIKEGKSVSVGTVLHVEISAETGLKEVSATLGESTNLFQETEDGIYVGTLTAPPSIGTFPIEVSLKNDLGKITVRSDAETIETTELPNPFKNIKSVGTAKKVTFTFEVDNEPTELAKFKFQYGTESGTLVKESITFEKEKIKTKDGSYSWYIMNLDPQTKYFRILGLDNAGKELSKMPASDIFEVNLSLASAFTCMVSNIANLQVTPGDGIVTLSWDTTPDATSGYNIYKRGADGQYALIENISTNSYIIHVAPDSVRYDDFAITGVCNNGEGESANFTEATNVKTGPTQLLVLFGLSALIAFFVTRRKFAFFRGN